jgi:twinkle protein
LRGIRPAELVTWCAGSGIGKSSMLREIVVNTLQSTEESVGLAFLEETPERTMRGIAGLHMNKPIHLDGIDYTGEEVDDAYSKLGLGHRVQFWEHWGSSQIDNVISRLRYMAKAMGSSLLVLDHISIVVSGDATTNERQTIDELMTRLRTEVVQQTNCSLHIVSHLTRPDGKPLELGAPVHLGLLRGSGAIAQLSDVVIAGERNSQAEDPTERNTIKLRVLKSRATGETGVACNLVYDRASGRLTELEDTL